MNIATALFLSAWYLSGLIILGHAISYNWSKIKKDIPLFLFGGIFGPTVIALLIFDKFVKDETKK